VIADELRAKAAEYRALGAAAGTRHEHLAHAMLTTEGPRGAALSIEANVADCMARQFRRWSEAYETAALELEDPAG
jgi:hypothetical protein